MKLIRGVEDPDYHRVAARLRQRFGPAPPATHVCHPLTCYANAMSEETLVRNRFLVGPVVSRNVFLIRCHGIHLCSEETCQLYGSDPTGTCPVSGLQYGTVVSSYSRDDSRTWYARLQTPQGPSLALQGPQEPAVKKQTTTRIGGPIVIPLEQQQQISSSVLRLLLWSTKRESRNTRVREQLTESANDACATHVRERRAAGQLPFWTDLYRIRGYMMSQQPSLQILTYDETLQDYYVAIICQVWERVTRFRADASEKLTRSDLEAVALGVLYGMRQTEYRCNGIMILAKDDFLAQELPPIPELAPYFGMERNGVTRGQKLFRKAFDHAFSTGVPHSEIELDMAAVTRAAASTIDPEATIRRDDRNRQVKITNKGEVLFMPVSRKNLHKK